MTKYIHIEKGMEDWLTPDLPNNYIDIEQGNKDIFTLDQVAIPGYGNYCPGDKYFSTENFFSELITEEARSQARSNLDISWKNLLGEVESAPGLKDFILDQLTWNNIHGDTTIIESLIGDELIIVNQDGKNKAVKASTLIKSAKEVYSIKLSEFKTPEDFNNLKAAVDAGNIIIVDGTIIKTLSKNIAGTYIMAATDITIHGQSENEHEYTNSYISIGFNSNGTYNVDNTQTTLKSGYDGTKFLADDGTYKEVISGIQEIPKATSSALGGIKTGFKNSEKNYKVQLDSNNNAYVNVPWTDNNTDTKNTAGTTEKLDTKLFLVGATSQGANPQTYSNTNVYIGSNNCLYSNGTKVSVEGHTHNYLSSLPSHTHSYTELTGSVADAANQAIVSSGTANGWKLYTLGSAAGKTASTSVSSSSTDSQVPTAKAVYTAITSGIKANDAMIFKGTLGTSGTITALPASHKIGDTYRVITAGTYAGVTCEIGDLVICITAGTAANNAHWTVAQTNIDGAVTGPASSTDGRVALFSGTSGKVLKQSSYTIGKSVPSDAVFTDTVYTHPSYKQVSSGLYKITTNSTGHITAATAVVKADITALGIPSTNTTYAVADYDTAGLIMPLKSYSVACTFGSSASTASTAVTVNSISTTSNRYYAIEMDKNGRAFVNVPWTDSDTKYTLPAATSSALGGIKVGFSTSGKNYKVQLDSSGNAYVNVPWEDNNTEYEKATSTTFGLVKIGYTTNGKNYSVALDSSGKMFVNVPWENTTYTNATQTTDGLMSKEDKTKLDGLTGAYIQIVTLATYEAMYAAGTLDENTVYHIKG